MNYIYEHVAGFVMRYDVLRGQGTKAWEKRDYDHLNIDRSRKKSETL